MSFASMKKNRSKKFEALKESMEREKKGKGSFKDDRYWTLTRNKETDIGQAVIRFLPGKFEDQDPWVKIFEYGFKGPGGWYIEKSLQTIKKADPCAEYNSMLWNKIGTEAAKEQAKKQGRRMQYHSNILVVKDPAVPENNGKVFLYSYGKFIHDMANAELNPEFEDMDPCNVFDMFEGKNFHLRSRRGDNGFVKYDKSTFSDICPLTDSAGNPLSEAEMEEIYNAQYDLSTLIAESEFKTYAELKTRLNLVLKLDQTESDEGSLEDEDDDLGGDFVPSFGERDASEGNQREAEEEKSTSNDDDDDDMAMFQGIMDGIDD